MVLGFPHEISDTAIADRISVIQPGQVSDFHSLAGL